MANKKKVEQVEEVKEESKRKEMVVKTRVFVRKVVHRADGQIEQDINGFIEKLEAEGWSVASIGVMNFYMRPPSVMVVAQKLEEKTE